MPFKNALNFMALFSGLLAGAFGGHIAYANDEEALEKEFRDYLNAAAVLVRADEAPGSANEHDLTAAIGLLDRGLREDPRLREFPEIRSDLIGAIFRFIGESSARSIVIREIFGGWIERAADGETVVYRSYPARLHTLERVQARLSYMKPAVAKTLAKRFFHLRRSLYLGTMTYPEARLFSDVCSEMAALTPNAVHRQGLLEARPYSVPTLSRVLSAVTAFENGEHTAENYVPLVEFLAVADVVDAEPQLEQRVLQALASFNIVDSADYLLEAIVRRRPSSDDSAAIVDEVLGMLVEHVESLQEGDVFVERLTGKLLKALVIDHADLRPEQAQRLLNVLRSLNVKLLQPKGQDTHAGEYSVPGLLGRVVEKASAETLIEVVREQIGAAKSAYYASQPGTGDACPMSFIVRMNKLHDISF